MNLNRTIAAKLQRSNASTVSPRRKLGGIPQFLTVMLHQLQQYYAAVARSLRDS